MTVITVPYKCKCMRDENVFQMQQRQDGEEIADFMKRVESAVTFSHRNHSPLCAEKALEYIKIPLDETNGIVGRREKK